ncbi:RIP metalloprotease RseP [Patescibacteria group bacterium]|nr:RIP metalloprotease RseP [Patescibacteria group bacterium]
MILTIIVFILILGILIFAHELGHFITAKKFGMKVEEFGFGYPPKLFSFKKGDTIYSLNLFPIGGFVRIHGELNEKKRSKSKKAFYNKPAWKRAIVLVAGVFCNLLIAAIFLSIVHMIGIPSIVEEGKNYKNIQIQVVEVAKDSPAKDAGIKIGDTIKSLNNQEIKELEDVQSFVAMNIGQEVNVQIKRGKEIIDKKVLLRISHPEGEGIMGIAMAKTGLISYPWYEAIARGFETTGRLFITFIKMFYLLIKNLIISGKLIADIAGPVGIANLTAQMVDLGFVYVLQFAAILSINLVILNLIPIPALDGGRLLLLFIEKLKGKPIKAKTEQLANGISFALLILLMIVITLRDVVNLF